MEGFQQNILNELSADIQENIRFPLRKLFIYLSELCGTADRPVILMIDEVDSAADFHVEMSFSKIGIEIFQFQLSLKHSTLI